MVRNMSYQNLKDKAKLLPMGGVKQSPSVSSLGSNNGSDGNDTPK